MTAEIITGHLWLAHWPTTKWFLTENQRWPEMFTLMTQHNPRLVQYVPTFVGWYTTKLLLVWVDLNGKLHFRQLDRQAGIQTCSRHSRQRLNMKVPPTPTAHPHWLYAQWM